MSADAFEDKFYKLDEGVKKYCETTEAGQASTKGLAKSLAQPTTALGAFAKTLGTTAL